MAKLKLMVYRWLPVFLWCFLIFYLSSIPNLKTSQNPFWDEILRKTCHFLEYLVLYMLFFRAINFRKDKKNFWLPFILTMFYAFSDEVHQSFVPTRTFRYKDILIDNSGNLVGGLIIWKLSQKAPKKLKNWVKKLDLI
jgi:VanZ family protein